jgi:hypothetical protein
MQITSSGKGVVSMPVLPITEQLLLRIEYLFKPIVVTPETSLNDIMFDAGRQSLIRWLRVQHESNTNQI